MSDTKALGVPTPGLPRSFQSFEELDDYLRVESSPDPGLPRLSIKRLVRHARVYGVDQVWETAVQSGLRSQELTALLAELKGTAADHRAAKKPQTWWDKVPASYTPSEGEWAALTQTQREVKALRDAGDSPAEIARKTGKGEKAVERLLDEVRKLEPLAVGVSVHAR